MNKKGFTLVELLAVIVLLGIIAMITVPTVLDSMNDSRRKSLQDTAYSIVQAATSYQAELQQEGKKSTFTLDFSKSADRDVLEVKGELPDAGQVSVDANGKVSLALWSNDIKTCVTKNKNSKNVVISDTITSQSGCVIK